jgi:hypothetical protein
MKKSRQLLLHRETLLDLEKGAAALPVGGASAPVSCVLPCNNASRGSNCCPTLGCA